MILSEPIGLDGVSRGKRASFDYIVNKGSWLDSRTFVVERRFLEQGRVCYWTLQFEGDKLSLRFRNTDGFTAELSGEQVN